MTFARLAGRNPMGKRIDQFCENLRQKLVMIDSGLDGLKAKIDTKTV
jgi:hypothetical protein